MLPTTNVHQLELFYYVVIFGGISRAARGMPYGIQQPAISKQIGQLERHLGTSLFERQPFRLTDAGQDIFGVVRRLFDELPTLRERVQHAHAPQLRIAASEFVLGEYVTDVVARMRLREPALHCRLLAGNQQQMQEWLQEGKVDLAIAALEGPPTGCAWLRIAQLPLAMLAPRRWRFTRPDDCWKGGRLAHPLVCPPSTEGVCRLFQRGLQQRGIAWEPAIETSSTASVTRHVSRGDTVGVSIDLPRLVRHPGVRVLPVPDFAPVEVAALWRAPVSPLLQTLLDVIGQRARELWPEQASG
jgi:DNA-binding transcriptional LysR family regulator